MAEQEKKPPEKEKVKIDAAFLIEAIAAHEKARQEGTLYLHTQPWPGMRQARPEPPEDTGPPQDTKKP